MLSGDRSTKMKIRRRTLCGAEIEREIRKLVQTKINLVIACQARKSVHEISFFIGAP